MNRHKNQVKSEFVSPAEYLASGDTVVQVETNSIVAVGKYGKLKNTPPSTEDKTPIPSKYNSHTPTQPYKYTPVPDVWVQVDGGKCWIITDTIITMEYEKLKEAWPDFILFDHPKIANKQVAVFTISKDQTKYKVSTATRTVQYCCYDATNDFMSKMLGKSLCSSDKDWFRDNPCVTSSGPGIHHMITVLNDLVAPYGIGVSKVYYPKLRSVSEDTKEWVTTLGVNPKAELDRDCSNEEYLEILSGGNKEIKDSFSSMTKDWNFEFVDSPPHGSYVLFRGGNNSLGHTIYSGPREKIGDFVMAIQFDFLDKITYHNNPISRDYTKEDKVNYVLDFYNCTFTDEEGKTKTIDTIVRKPTYTPQNEDWRTKYAGYMG